MLLVVFVVLIFSSLSAVVFLLSAVVGYCGKVFYLLQFLSAELLFVLKIIVVVIIFVFIFIFVTAMKAILSSDEGGENPSSTISI